MKLNKKTIFSLLIAVIFLSSILVVMMTNKSSKGEAIIIIDLGFGKRYSNHIPLTEGMTALNAISSMAYSVDIQNGTIDCIANYCNTNSSHWEVYEIENGFKLPLNDSLEKHELKNGETIMFEYVYS